MARAPIAAFLRLLAKAHVYDLGQPHREGMPVHPADPPFIFHLYRTHAQTRRWFRGGFAFALETVFTSMHAGTHLDARAHMSQRGKLYRGVDADAITTPSGFTRYGVEEAPIVATRGVLLDVAGARGVDALPPRYGVTAADLEAAARFGGTEVRPGEAALIRTGYARFFATDRARYVHDHPGVSISGARWLVRHRVAVTGADNLAYEALPSRTYRVHTLLLTRHGIYLLKNLMLEALAHDRLYEFPFIAIPLRMVGATGSLLRPIAVVPRGSSRAAG